METVWQYKVKKALEILRDNGEEVLGPAMVNIPGTTSCVASWIVRGQWRDGDAVVGLARFYEPDL